MKNRILKNASWMIICRIFQSVLALVVGSFAARYLGPSNYGLLNYAASLTSFFAPITYLGLNSILIQEIATSQEKDGEILGTSILTSIISALLCILGVSSFAVVANFDETETIIVCILYSISLLFQAVDLIQYWFQAKLKSHCTAITMLAAYIVVSIYKVYLLISEKSVYWFAVTNAFDYFIIAIVLLIVYKKAGGQSLSFSWTTCRRLLSKSKYYIVSNLMVVVFTQTDKLMLKIMLSDHDTGYYSAAITTAGLASFVYSAIIDSFKPTIYKSAREDYSKYESNLVKLYSIVFYLSLFQCIAVTIASNFIVLVLYGEDFYISANVLRLAVWYTPFSYAGVVRGIWLLSENKQKYLVVSNLCGAFSNVILNLIFIPALGIYGAAIATLITQFFSNIVLGFFIKPIRRNNTLMVKAMSPKFFCSFIKEMIREK